MFSLQQAHPSITEGLTSWSDYDSEMERQARIASGEKGGYSEEREETGVYEEADERGAAKIHLRARSKA